ncbi:Protein of unknown function DUF4403 [Gemmatirosa kalamazoonensis]|uniref:DUF4403 family protein n=1 Tax=Gemmatirosa kalamazoonensis TaxID=861299 RepID=W0R924_9BACT|nr:DUF4403 family protein [Gemmatirosa kalamazoonensis]AHG87619.1 Protein of unknown function DUF4403 [Gemmatirosa kalamazoonensis]
MGDLLGVLVVPAGDGGAPSRGGAVCRRTWAVALACAAASCLAAGCGRDRGKATPAQGTPGAADTFVDTIPELDPSLVEVPIRYELGPAIGALERAVPRTVGNLDDRRKVPGHDRLSYAFVAERTPFDVSVRGSTVTVSSVVTYHARGWLKPPIGPSLGGSCGIGGDAPRLRVTLTSTVKLAPDWTLRAHTQVPTVAPASDEPRDKCKMTVLNVDLTDRVVDAVQKLLDGKAALLDERIAKLDLKSRVEKWWAQLARPIKVGGNMWLQLRPEAVSVGSLRAGDGAVIAPVALAARPRLLSGPRPESSTVALPNFTPSGPKAAERGSSLHLLLEAVLDYDQATRMLGRQLVGRTFTRSGHTVTVREARVFGARGGRVGLALRLAGDVDARLVLAGRPVYDHASGTLHVPDLDYAVADASLLVRGADQVGHDAFRDALRERAVFPVTALVDSARARAERAMNRELTKGVRLGAKVETGRALGVFAASDGLRVRAAAGGVLSLDIDRAPPVKVRRASSPAPPSRRPAASDPPKTPANAVRPAVRPPDTR